MPRKKCIPAYRLHKPSGQVRVIIDCRHVYLGQYGSPESRETYARLIAERFTPAIKDRVLADASGFPDLSINELLLRYVEFAERYYSKDGATTKEFVCMKEAMGPLRFLFGELPAREFGPRKLKAVRQHMLDADLSRGVINQRINRIKRIIK